MRLIFMGSPAFALPTMEELLAAGHEMGLVVSQPDRPAGRGRQLRPSRVAERARERHLPLFQPETFRLPEAVERLKSVGAEGIVVAAFGMILPRPVLDLVEGRAANVHPSLLPRHRGATPIQATLLAGEALAGVTIIQMVARMDAGPIIAQRAVPLGPEDDFASLEPMLAREGAKLLVESLDPWLSGRISPEPQDESQASYCPKLSRKDALLDWSASAETLWRKVRAYRGTLDASTLWEDRVLKVLQAAPIPEAPEGRAPGDVFAWTAPSGQTLPAVVCAEGALALGRVMLEGKRETTGDAFLRGYPRFVGARLG